jgi:hypothetical protein
VSDQSKDELEVFDRQDPFAKVSTLA